MSADRPEVSADLARLHDLLAVQLGLNVPFRALCPEHDPPFAYLQASLGGPPRDLLVWSCRGGGKTLLAAVATWVELARQPGRSVRVLAGSQEQGRRMLEYLDLLAERLGPDLVAERSAHRVALVNGSAVDVLAHAETSVRGHHVDTLRCDEIELFDEAVFTAALFTPDRPATLGGLPGGDAGGRLEALSTLHRVGGLMARLVGLATAPAAGPGGPAPPLRLLRWCLLDVLERCPPSRSCTGCPLQADCGGAAREATGFFPIASALALRARVSHAAWDAEALCRRPSLQSAVFSQFDPVRHVAQAAYDPALPQYRALDLGFTNPSVCLWAQRTPDGAVRIINELVCRQVSLATFATEIQRRTLGTVQATFCDPAAAQHGLITASSAADELRRCGVPIRCQPSRIADGIEQIRAALDGPPGRLVIAPGCAVLIRSLERYRYPHPGEAGDPEKPVKDGEHDHAVDALRYLFIGLRTAGPVVQRRY